MLSEEMETECWTRNHVILRQSLVYFFHMRRVIISFQGRHLLSYGSIAVISSGVILVDTKTKFDHSVDPVSMSQDRRATSYSRITWSFKDLSLLSAFCFRVLMMKWSGVYLQVLLCCQGFPGGSDGKETACNVGDLGSIPGSGRPLEEGRAAHSSLLAWRIPWAEKPGRLQSTGLQRVRHDWATSLSNWSYRTLIFNLYFL